MLESINKLPIIVDFVGYGNEPEVIGLNLLSLVRGCADYNVLSILYGRGLYPVEPYRWYSLAGWLGALKDIGQATGLSLTELGIRATAHAALPPWVDSLSSALLAVEQAYKMSHRHPGAGEVRVQPDGAGGMRLVLQTPYSDAYILGVIQGCAMKLRPNARLNLTYRASTASYLIQG